ncbi:Mannosyltransferase related to Gpi18 [Pseudobutyrivibrio sp. YE44]|uniref:hypothetical protein n=1 Tax=Pseudobutyrivibrio sp. YE44 TaxID=1520802 RepID=UPI0008806EFC|nr:hypothetical protein [Pseudobutyrivibrio sp. YE44]SDB54002.1 Mannosyltransferase related to Gpi18 [Pseudobutyrivibrio sp. YE44]
MFKVEKKIVEWTENNIFIIYFFVATIISIYARYSSRDFVSTDMEFFLLPWFDDIRNRGGLGALNSLVGDYNITYQTLIAFLTYLPFKPMYMYKFCSCLFDYLIAGLIYILIAEITGDKQKAVFSHVMFTFLPIVVFNSSLWGQCDAIYSFFVLLSFWLVVREKYQWGFFAFGISLAFKLQSIFFLPFLLFYYIYKKSFSIFNFLYIPVAMVACGSVGLLKGLPISNLWQVYIAQKDNSTAISLNYPSLWAVTTLNGSELYFNDLYTFAVGLAFMVLLSAMVYLIKLEKEFSLVELVQIAFIFIYTTVIILPGMHERYGYLYIVFGFIAIVLKRKLLLNYLVLCIIDIMTYGDFLFDIEINWVFLSIVNIICWSISFYTIMKELKQ